MNIRCFLSKSGRSGEAPATRRRRLRRASVDVQHALLIVRLFCFVSLSKRKEKRGRSISLATGGRLLTLVMEMEHINCASKETAHQNY